MSVKKRNPLKRFRIYQPDKNWQMCSHWAKCKYPFFGDIQQFLGNMNPSIHSTLSLAGTSILLETETVNNCLRGFHYGISNKYSEYIPRSLLPWIPECCIISAY